VKWVLIALALLGPLEGADHALQHAVQNARAPALEGPMRRLTEAGKPVVVFAGLLVVAAFDVAAGPATARLALLALAPTNLAVEGLKRATCRTRPDGDHDCSNASFPSSHAANAFALAWVLAHRYRRWGWIAWLAAAGVGFSRVYLNRHFVSDVIVGALIGALCAWGAARFLAWLRSRRLARAEIG
jgi:undecaprenyl-diphosphatase